MIDLDIEGQGQCNSGSQMPPASPKAASKLGRECNKCFGKVSKCFAFLDCMLACIFWILLLSAIAVHGSDLREAESSTEISHAGTDYYYAQSRQARKLQFFKDLYYGFEADHWIYLALAFPRIYIAFRNSIVTFLYFITIKVAYQNSTAEDVRTAPSIPVQILFWFHQLFIVGYDVFEVYTWVMIFGNWWFLADSFLICLVLGMFFIRCLLTVALEKTLSLSGQRDEEEENQAQSNGGNLNGATGDSAADGIHNIIIF